jgi:hypothetical protein
MASAIAGLWLHWPGALWLTPLIPAVSAWAWHLARVEPRQLRWDGQCWRLSPADAAVKLEVLMDLQSWLLLRADGRIYLPLSQRAQAPLWGMLRATLYSARPENPGA